jgi:hypothetical protein
MRDGALPPGLAAPAKERIPFSDAPGRSPQHFTDRRYSFTLHLHDVASDVSGAVTFTGLCDGTLSRDNVNLHTRFTSPRDKTLELGHHLYEVRIDGVSLLGIPGGRAGSIGLYVTVSDARPHPAVVSAAPGNTLGTFSGRRLLPGQMLPQFLGWDLD